MNQLTLPLEVGKKYILRNGEVAEILDITGCIAKISGKSLHHDGAHSSGVLIDHGRHLNSVESPYDIVADHVEDDSDTTTSNTVHPLLNPSSSHYSMVDGVEAIERMEQMFSIEDLKAWAKLSAMKYRLRITRKDEVEKEAEKIKGFEAYYKYLCDLEYAL